MKLNKKRLIIGAILLFMFIFVGCNKFRVDTYKENTNITDEPTNLLAEDNGQNEDIDVSNNGNLGDTKEVETESELSISPTDEVVQPVSNVELMIYVVNGDGDLEARTALVSKDIDITPEIVVDTVVESMADNSIMVGIEEVISEDDTIIVSFYSDKAPLTNVGSGIEIGILNAIAQSLLDNLDDYNKIIYRAEGEVYSSGHIELAIDEVYMER